MKLVCNEYSKSQIHFPTDCQVGKTDHMFKWSDQKDIYKIIYTPKSNYKNNVSDGHLLPWLAARNSQSWDIKFCNQKFQRLVMDNRLKKKIGRRKREQETIKFCQNSPIVQRRTRDASQKS